MESIMKSGICKCKFIQLFSHLWIGTGNKEMLFQDDEFKHIGFCFFWGPKK